LSEFICPQEVYYNQNKKEVSSLASLEEYYISQYDKQQADQQAHVKECHDKITQMGHELVAIVPIIIKRMITAAEISRPECQIISLDGQRHASWNIEYSGDEYDHYSINLLVDGRLVDMGRGKHSSPGNIIIDLRNPQVDDRIR
jgi:hypothetical protein